jgi:hypothetical protein
MGMFFGSTDVDIWRVSIEIDDGDSIRVVEIVRRTDPAAIPAGVRQVFYDADTAQGALTRIGGQDGEAIRFLLTAERIAPQHVRTSDRARPDHPDPARPIPPPSPVAPNCAPWTNARRSPDASPLMGDAPALEAGAGAGAGIAWDLWGRGRPGATYPQS